MTNIQINKYKKTNFFLAVFKTLSFWIITSFSFFFNYKFIEGNNFLDFIIFLAITLHLIVIVYGITRVCKIYNNVSENKIKKIEEILIDGVKDD